MILTIPVLVEMANANASGHDGLDAVLKTIAGAEIAVAIWQDHSHSLGVSMLTVKGENLVRNAVAENKSVTAKVTAIRCIDAEQAFALLDLAGCRDRLQ